MKRKLIETLKDGQVAVIPTDTIYGLVASVFSPEAMERLYQIREREKSKPFIVLIADFEDLKKFGVEPTAKQEKTLKKFWPGPVSVVLGCRAFRLPAKEDLRQLLRQTGPLVAPSANPAGLPPATTIAEAKCYFGNQVNLYLDGGKIDREPSTLVVLDTAGKITLLRGTLGTYGNRKK